MKKELIKVALICFATGLFAGYLVTPEIQKIEVTDNVIPKLSSEGRAAADKMVEEVNNIIKEDISEITAEKTRMLQAITARKPDRVAANFHLAGMEEQMRQTQAKISKVLLDTVSEMPLIDRRAYMKYYLNLRPCLRTRSIVLPVLVVTSDKILDRCNLTPLMPSVK